MEFDINRRSSFVTLCRWVDRPA